MAQILLYTDDSPVYGSETSTDQLSLLMLNEWLNDVKDAFIIFLLKKEEAKLLLLLVYSLLLK